ncbi:MAG: BON domain-containing protein [Firmicutes bacterium]|nr:BON domain-containing protein [Bacillota bacterium]
MMGLAFRFCERAAGYALAVLLTGAMICLHGSFVFAESVASYLSVESREDISLHVGESRCLEIEGLARVAVGDPTVADVKVLDQDACLLVGMEPGRTTLIVWTKRGAAASQITVTSRPPVDLNYLVKLFADWDVSFDWWHEYLVVEGSVRTENDKDTIIGLIESIWEPVLNLIQVHSQQDSFSRLDASVSLGSLKRALNSPEITVQVIKDLIILEGTVSSKAEQVKAEQIAAEFSPKVLNLIKTKPVEKDMPDADETVPKPGTAEKSPLVSLKDIELLCSEWGYDLRWLGEILLLEGAEKDPKQTMAVKELLQTVDVYYVDITRKHLPAVEESVEKVPKDELCIDELTGALSELPGLSDIEVAQIGKRLVLKGLGENTQTVDLAYDIAADYAVPLGIGISNLIQLEDTEEDQNGERQPVQTIKKLIGIPGLSMRWLGDSLILQGGLPPKEHKAAVVLANEFADSVVDLIDEIGLNQPVLDEISRLLGSDTLQISAVENTLILQGEVDCEAQKVKAAALANAFGYPVVDGMVIKTTEAAAAKELSALEIQKTISIDSIEVNVINGFIILEGIVDHTIDKTKAALIASTFGEVIDLIEVNVFQKNEDESETDWTHLTQEAEKYGVKLYLVGQSPVLEGTVSAEDAAYLTQLMDREFPDWLNRLRIYETPAPLPELADVKLLLDNPNVHCRYVGSVLVLQGTVKHEKEIERAEKAVSILQVPVHNLLTVVEPAIEQIWVDVCMLEISQSTIKELGFEWQMSLEEENGEAQYVQIQGVGLDVGPGQAPNPFGLMLGPLWAKVELRSLLQNGAARVLASPSILAENGAKAEFLAGGEIPVPLEGGIDWKPYGVGLNVQPTILPNGTIHMHIEPEVSSLDWENAVQMEDTTIPGLITRRWKTQAALAPGKVLAIGGLIQEEDHRRQKQVPFLGELPILGSLFRSEVQGGQQTDLVVIVSPRLVQDDDPVWADALQPTQKAIE